MSFFDRLFGITPQRKVTTVDNIVDLITYASGLVSNPDEINPILHRIHPITAKLAPDQPPAEEDMPTLLEAYLEIERYLTVREVIREFTPAELRSKASDNLRQQITSFEAKLNKSQRKLVAV